MHAATARGATDARASADPETPPEPYERHARFAPWLAIYKTHNLRANTPRTSPVEFPHESPLP